MTSTCPQSKPMVIALMGPTASGKTDLAIALHQQVGAEIISVDSAMVYRGLDIGAAKPSAAELAAAPHRLIDIRDPAEPYSAADFCRDATREIEAILAAGKTPLLVGGTMLYFKALRDGLSEMPASDPQTRLSIEREAQQKGWPALHAELQRLDPQTAAQLHPNHSHRIGRALEVYRQSGKTMSEFRTTTEPGLADMFDWRQIVIAPRERHVLHERIAKRFAAMLDQNFIDEVSALHSRGDLAEELPAIRAVGYRQVWQYLSGELNYEEMKAKAIAATRQLAKRQLTWLRGWPDLCWLYSQHQNGKNLEQVEIVNKALSFLHKTPI